MSIYLKRLAFQVRANALLSILSLAFAGSQARLGYAEVISSDFSAATRSVRDLLSELVAADTTNPPGNEARAVAIGVSRLKTLDIPYEITEFAPGRQNLVARIRGSGKEKPLLLLAHIDVVGAPRETWNTDPHRLEEVGDYLVGRGVFDDLGMAAISLEVLGLLKRSGVPLKRDIIIAWTGGEESETGLDKGINYLLNYNRASIEASLALNEGGSPILGEDGKVKLVEIQAAEKIHQNFEVLARGPTGHSGMPLPGNAIFRLAKALDRLAGYQFPAHLIPVTREYFRMRANLERSEMAKAMREVSHAKGPLPRKWLKALEKEPALSAKLRTTCVATLLSGGTRINALPGEAKANINCRILPDETIEGTLRKLTEIFQDPSLEIKATTHYGHSGPSVVTGEGPQAITKVSKLLWPHAIVMPVLGGSTDSKYLRKAGIPTYGINPIAVTEVDARRAHGANERIPVASLRQGVEFLYHLVMELSAVPDHHPIKTP